METTDGITRRHFVGICGKTALTLPLLAGAGFPAGCADGSSRLRKRHRYEKLLLKNGAVYQDGGYRPVDVAIEGGVITGLGPGIDPDGRAESKVVDCSGLFISPGWVDVHCHIGGIGVDPGLLGPEMGVTALVDAGTYGAANFQAFRDRYAVPSPIPVYSFLNVRNNGIRFSHILFNSLPALEDLPEAMRLARDNPDIIKGFKVRLDSLSAADDFQTHLSAMTARLSGESELPVMYHLGKPSPVITDFLKHSRPGDIITHFLRNRTNCIFNDSGTLRPEATAAKAKGVLYDIGHGVGSFEFDTAKKALDQGFSDFTISSDLWFLPSLFKCRTFANVASKFLALGLSLEDVTEKISVKPRNLLKIESGIGVNKAVDLTVFALADGDFTYYDTAGKTLPGHRRIIPEYAVVKGDLIRAGDRDRRLFIS
ncbi:MAG: hypothetical protein ACOZF0_17770 [Thermodesulfobacteriota bacterium]